MNRTVGIGLMCCLLLSGCETMQMQQQRREQQVRDQMAARQMEERLRRIEGRMQASDAEIARLAQDVQQAHSDIYALNQQLGKLGASVSELDERQVRDTKKIATTVLGKLDDIEKHAAAPRNGYSGPAREHTVESGQTLSAIAAAYKTTVKSIKDANHLKSDMIRIGQKLIIPQ